MTNKYSEGYPGARYYGGNEYVSRPYCLLCGKVYLDNDNEGSLTCIGM